jgi:septin family protein
VSRRRSIDELLMIPLNAIADNVPFSILVIGEQNSGKTSFIDFLCNALATPSRKRQQTPSPPQTAMPGDSPFTPHYLETDVDHERIGVTLWDSQGLEKKFVDLQLREMSSFLESKFEETFTEEQKVVRAPGVRDTHIHCVFLILDPTRLDANLAYSRKLRIPPTKFDEAVRLVGILDEDLDIQILRALQGKTTVIPVISKADTITTTNMALLKKAVWDSLKLAKLDPLEALNINEDDDEEEKTFDERDEDAYIQSGDEDNEDHSDLIDNLIDRSSEDGDEVHNSTPPTSPPKADASKSHRRSMSGTLTATANDEIPFLPLSIISPDSYEKGIVGRRFPWGFADPYNETHCDFVKLKDAVFSEWRGELREASREVWYEGWRTSRLKRRERAPTAGTSRVTANTYRTTPAPIPLPNPGSPEMLPGRGYRTGVNAF